MQKKEEKGEEDDGAGQGRARQEAIREAAALAAALSSEQSFDVEEVMGALDRLRARVQQSRKRSRAPQQVEGPDVEAEPRRRRRGAGAGAGAGAAAAAAATAAPQFAGPPPPHDESVANILTIMAEEATQASPRAPPRQRRQPGAPRTGPAAPPSAAPPAAAAPANLPPRGSGPVVSPLDRRPALARGVSTRATPPRLRTRHPPGPAVERSVRRSQLAAAPEASTAGVGEAREDGAGVVRTVEARRSGRGAVTPGRSRRRDMARRRSLDPDEKQVGEAPRRASARRVLPVTEGAAEGETRAQRRARSQEPVSSLPAATAGDIQRTLELANQLPGDAGLVRDMVHGDPAAIRRFLTSACRAPALPPSARAPSHKHKHKHVRVLPCAQTGGRATRTHCSSNWCAQGRQRWTEGQRRIAHSGSCRASRAAWMS